MIGIESHVGKEIFILDFSDCKENEIIEMLTRGRDMIISEGKPCLVLGVFNERSFITPKVMFHFNSYRRNEVGPFLAKQAVIGISETKKIILKGVNFLSQRTILSFNSKQEAIEYLTM